jgi:hypothetical protein
MAPAAPEAFDHRRRSAAGCLCCGSHRLRREVQIVSGFLAARAWNGRPELTELVCCKDCGLHFFDRGLDDAEVARYYLGSRDAEYQRTRHEWEPFYTAGQHASLLAWSDSASRRDNLCHSLSLAAAPTFFNSVLDHGGSQGHMLAAVKATRKAVYDPSASPAVEGVESYSRAGDLPRDWTLILSCQVLEHTSSPAAYLQHIHALLGEDGWLYVEVPNESWHPAIGPEALRKRVLRKLLPMRPLLIAADVLCTVLRVKYRRLPPLGFVAMREHLNYFTAESLTALLERNGFQVATCGIDNGGQLFAVARKFATGAARTRNTADGAA